MKLYFITLSVLTWTAYVLCQNDQSAKELRLVLVGRSGSGKSAAGNTILGRDVFHVDSTFASVTETSVQGSGMVAGRKVKVIDTPGLFDTTKSPEELKSEIEKCVELSLPGPHVFLLVVRLGVRFTEEEKNTMKWIQDNFGKEANEFAMVLFTHGDLLKGRSVEELINEDVITLIQSCKGGYHVLDNTDKNGKAQVETLLEKIEKMVDVSQRQCYSNKMYEDVQHKKWKREWLQRACSYVPTAVGAGVGVFGGPWGIAAGASLGTIFSKIAC